MASQHTLHALGDLDAEERHGVLDNLCHVLRQHEAHGLLLLVGLVEDAVVVIELVEDLRQLVALVGNARRTVILAGLLYDSTILAEFLDEFDLLLGK